MDWKGKHRRRWPNIVPTETVFPTFWCRDAGKKCTFSFFQTVKYKQISLPTPSNAIARHSTLGVIATVYKICYVPFQVGLLLLSTDMLYSINCTSGKETCSVNITQFIEILGKTLQMICTEARRL